MHPYTHTKNTHTSTTAIHLISYSFVVRLLCLFPSCNRLYAVLSQKGTGCIPPPPRTQQYDHSGSDRPLLLNGRYTKTKQQHRVCKLSLYHFFTSPPSLLSLFVYFTNLSLQRSHTYLKFCALLSCFTVFSFILFILFG